MWSPEDFGFIHAASLKDCLHYLQKIVRVCVCVILFRNSRISGKGPLPGKLYHCERNIWKSCPPQALRCWNSEFFTAVLLWDAADAVCSCILAKKKCLVQHMHTFSQKHISQIDICMHICIHTYIYICIHIYICIYIYI